MKTVTTEGHLSWRDHLLQDALVLRRFARRYGPAVLTLWLAAVIGWSVANGVSNYTHGGWELHIERRFNQDILVNIHFHHWYYGIPLALIAFALIRSSALLSTFVFGLGNALSSHSFINEGGIPSIIEGGETWRVAAYIYFPIVTALALLYAFFLVRREEWLARAREREEIAASYIGPREKAESTFARLDEWARQHFSKKKLVRDPDTQIWYGEWSGLDRELNGEWQMHYTVTPYDPLTLLWVFRIEHIPLRGEVGLIDDWMRELNAVVRHTLTPILLRELEPSAARAASAAGGGGLNG